MREKRLKYNGNAMKELKRRIGFSNTRSVGRFLKSGAGFTLVELGVVVGILATLIGFTTISLLNVQQKASINTTIQTIISDMNGQKIKAMIGDTEGKVLASAYGVHFNATGYVLFYGSVYSAAETTNFEVSLPENLQFTTLTDIIFSQITGELPGVTSVAIKNITNNEERSIQLNKYGVVTGVN